MNNSRTTEPSPGLALSDIYFVLFRHKWKILIFATTGIVAATAYYLLSPPPSQSEAKLFIRYVLDSRSHNPTANSRRESSASELGESIIGNEIQILTSIDVLQQVATSIGPEKILAGLGGGNDPFMAANAIKKNLTVAVPAKSSVIHIIFRHPDSAIVQPVLRGIISSYLERHLEVHQSLGISDNFLTEETTLLRSQISQTENELRAAKTNAGIISVEDAQKTYSIQLGKIRETLFQAESDLAGRQATLIPKATNTLATATETPSDQFDEYQKICIRMDFLRKREIDYLTLRGYAQENTLVKEVRGLIAETRKSKKSLEEQFPTLAGLHVQASILPGQPAQAAVEGESVLALQSKISVFKQQMKQIRSEAAEVDQAESIISNLQRKKQLQEGNYQYFATSLEQTRIDEALGAGRVSNISPVQTPSPALKDWSKKFKAMLLMILGGLLGGVALAFFIEFYVDTSVKRSNEVEARLKLPLFLSIPDMSKKGHKHLGQPAGRRKLNNGNGMTANENGKLEIVAWEASSFLNPFYDALRDRLMTHFESINLTRKPKLVAVTGTDNRSGVSTIASGLAASLSETGDGKVLLVDMNLECGAARQFFRGKPGGHLDDALVNGKRDSALVQENLYVVTEGSNSEKLQRVLPKRFASLVPKLKASDYDYIIFDMPPVTQTSMTARLAGLMDMTLLVIESEKTNRASVQQAAALLALSKANVGAVLNKTRKYVPARLHRESLGDI